MNRFTKLFFIIVLLNSTTHGLKAQDNTSNLNSKIQKHLLLEDLELLRNNLEKAQPGLYNYTPKPEMDAFFETLRSSITGDMSSIEFFRRIAPLSHKIKNGHTILVPSSDWEDQVITNMDLLPLDLYFYDGQLYVLHNLSDHTEIEAGSILQSIHGKPAMEVFDFMVHRWFKDGHNLSRPREIVEEEFRLLYAHFFGATKTYPIEIITPDGKHKTLDLMGIKESEFKKRLMQRYQKDYVPWWRRAPQPLSLKIEDNTAYLAITQFSNGVKSDNGQRFGSFVKTAFKTIKDKEVKNLVLDLRGNQGGDVKPQLELLRHLIKKPFHLYKEVHAKVRKLPNPQYYEFDLLSRTAFKKNFKNEESNGMYPMKNRLGFEEQPQSPSSNLFEGQLFVLIDGWSFSATGEVCGIIKEHRKDAIFVGEETGGNPVTNISGIQTFMTLPHSKNRILICLVSYTTDVTYENDGHGVKATYEVRNSISDMLQHRDAVIEKVNALISKSNE